MNTPLHSRRPGLRWLVRAAGISTLLQVATHAVLAADVTSYGASKYRSYEQSGPLPAGEPTAAGYGFYAHAYLSSPGALLFGLVSGPGGIPAGLSENSDDARLLESDESQGSQSDLDSTFPNGSYSFQLFNAMGQAINSQLTLSGDAYPTAPALANYSAAQDIDRGKAFALNWTKPAELDANDYVVVVVRVDGTPVYSSPFPWQLGALPGTAITASIPANTLPATGSLEGEISFINVTARDTQTIPGATGLAGYISRTTFPLAIHAGSGGGGGDTTPPVLLSVSPTLGALGVAPATPVVFLFSEVMKPQQQVSWPGLANSASLSYAWSGDGKSLTCTYPGGFPASSTIAWQLASSGFADLAGNLLSGNNLSGAFITSAGSSTNPCQGGSAGRLNSFFIARMAQYSQASAAAPVPVLNGVDDTAASFFASFAPSGISLSAAAVLLPGGQRKTLDGVFGQYFFTESFPTEAALLTAYPNGTYTGELTPTGAAKYSQSVTAGTGSNTPHNSNFDPAQIINPASAFTLGWDAFANPGVNDRIDITIYDELGREILHLPDECAVPPKPLPVTATSCVIPANLLEAAKIYPVQLTFSRITDFKSNAAPAIVTLSAYNKTTRFNIKTIGGGTPNSTPVITGYRIAADGHFEADVTGAIGHTIKLEASDLGSTWSTVGSILVPAGGKVTVRDTRLASASKSQVFRARSE